MTRRSYHKRAAQKRWQRRAPGFLCGRSKMARERKAQREIAAAALVSISGWSLRAFKNLDVLPPVFVITKPAS